MKAKKDECNEKLKMSFSSNKPRNMWKARKNTTGYKNCKSTPRINVPNVSEYSNSLSKLKIICETK